jgi:hypothetical protein
MRPVFNPTRRNRNIGTAWRGHGQNNRLIIPNTGRLFSPLERIGDHRVEHRSVAGMNLDFIVEHSRPGCIPPCTIDDVVQMLELIPASDWAGIHTVFFRQPTRKQARLNPAWGRLFYSGEIITARGRVIAAGPMIHLEAIDHNHQLEWGTSLALEDQVELDRLRADGHIIERSGNRHVIRATPASARNTQLYRTLPHEIGHWFDWLGKVETPLARGGDFDALTTRYFARPSAEREAFAHRYADETHARLLSTGSIPFETR